MKTSDVDDPVTLNIPNASGLDRGFELDRNRIRIVVQPYLESVPPDALVLAILPPKDGTSPPIPFSQGFVMHNTHSLPTNTENIQVDLGQLFGGLAAMPIPLRALTPTVRYLGDQNAGTFSVKRYNSLLSIINNTIDVTQAVLGFPGSPRYVEPQIGPGDSTNWPFFYEDKRNQFYVSVQPNFVPYNYWQGFGGLTALSPSVSQVAHIPPLTTTQFPVNAGPNPVLLGLAATQGPAVDWTYAGAGRTLAAGIASQATFSFQGRTIGLTGGTPAAALPTNALLADTAPNHGG
jgi:hypothetical protein